MDPTPKRLKIFFGGIRTTLALLLMISNEADDQ
jgi:hypothetical protein